MQQTAALAIADDYSADIAVMCLVPIAALVPAHAWLNCLRLVLQVGGMPLLQILSTGCLKRHCPLRLSE